MPRVFLLLFCLLAFSFADEQVLTSRLTEAVLADPGIAHILIFYNPQTSEDPQLPEQIGQARVKLVQIKNIGEVERTMTRYLNSDENQAVFLIDDRQRVVTNQATLKFVRKLQLKRNFRLFSDSPGFQ